MDKLRWIKITYDVKDLGGGVISQGAMVRRFKDKNPDLVKDVRADGSFKIDHQTHTVSMRIGVVDRDETNQPIVEKKYRPENIPSITEQQKLLNPGYDELKKRYDALVVAVGKDAQKFSDLLVENENLKKKVEELTANPFSECPHCIENTNLKAENDRLILRLSEMEAETDE